MTYCSGSSCSEKRIATLLCDREKVISFHDTPLLAPALRRPRWRVAFASRCFARALFPCQPRFVSSHTAQTSGVRLAFVPLRYGESPTQRSAPPSAARRFRRPWQRLKLCCTARAATRARNTYPDGLAALAGLGHS